jgi:hypothetical protein
MRQSHPTLPVPVAFVCRPVGNFPGRTLGRTHTQLTTVRGLTQVVQSASLQYVILITVCALFTACLPLPSPASRVTRVALRLIAMPVAAGRSQGGAI